MTPLNERCRRHGGRLLAWASVLVAVMGSGMAFAQPEDPFADPAKPALPGAGMRLDLARSALVVIDPQIDFMSEKGAAWGAVGEAVTKTRLVPHLLQLLEAAKQAGMVVAVSPHYYYPHDHTWEVQGPAELFQHKIKLFDRASALRLDGFRGSGADFLPEFKPYIEDGRTIVASPHQLYGPSANDLVLQLRKQRVDQVVLAGMLSNLCVESHLRELLENGFEVAVVRDAVAGPKLPEGDGNLSALINYRYIANGLWTTQDTVARIRR